MNVHRGTPEKGVAEPTGRRTRVLAIAAIVAGAAVYVAAAFVRTDILPRILKGLSEHWARSIDESLIYIISLLAGFVAALVFRHKVLTIGFCASALGSLVRSLLKLFMTLHVVGWMEIRRVPLGFMADIVFAAFASGVLGAAGAAVAVVVCRPPEPGERNSTS